MPSSAITMSGTADHDGAEWAVTMSETCIFPYLAERGAGFSRNDFMKSWARPIRFRLVRY